MRHQRWKDSKAHPSLQPPCLRHRRIRCTRSRLTPDRQTRSTPQAQSTASRRTVSRSDLRHLPRTTACGSVLGSANSRSFRASLPTTTFDLQLRPRRCCDSQTHHALAKAVYAQLAKQGLPSGDQRDHASYRGRPQGCQDRYAHAVHSAHICCTQPQRELRSRRQDRHGHGAFPHPPPPPPPPPPSLPLPIHFRLPVVLTRLSFSFNAGIGQRCSGIAALEAHDEGPDDSVSHTKASLIGPSITCTNFQWECALGTWQGFYLCEFRRLAHKRKIVATILP